MSQITYPEIKKKNFNSPFKVKLLKRGKNLLRYWIQFNVLRKISDDSNETRLEPLHPKQGTCEDNKMKIPAATAEKD
jgi:hypothetical protein